MGVGVFIVVCVCMWSVCHTRKIFKQVIQNRTESKTIFLCQLSLKVSLTSEHHKIQVHLLPGTQFRVHMVSVLLKRYDHLLGEPKQTIWRCASLSVWLG